MTINRLWLGLLLLTWQVSAEVRLTPVTITALADVTPGEAVVLAAGVYPPLRLTVPMTLMGEPGARIDARHQGHGLYIDAPDVQISNLEITNWGKDLGAMDSAIFISKQGQRAEVKDSWLHGPGFGIWVDGAPDVQLHRNRIEGELGLRSQDRGNGIHLYAVTGALVIDNRIRWTRDGIYISYSNGNRLQGNELSELRYGIHYMYAHNNQVVANYTHHTRTGYALMQSRQLTVTGNVSEQDENYGILMNYITYSRIANNRIEGVKANSHLLNPRGAEGKAIFAYQAVGNEISGNWLADNDLGLHATAGSEQNRIYANAFVGNRTQVRYVSNQSQEWSYQGQGNYWSDYLGWDLNQDKLGDVPYEPNDSMDRVLWQYPAARWLLNAPVISLLRWVQQQFPVFKGPGVTDSYPLMALPERPNPAISRDRRQEDGDHSLTAGQ